MYLCVSEGSVCSHLQQCPWADWEVDAEAVEERMRLQRAFAHVQRWEKNILQSVIIHTAFGLLQVVPAWLETHLWSQKSKSDAIKLPVQAACMRAGRCG